MPCRSGWPGTYLLCSPGCPLIYGSLFASASQVLGSQTCVTLEAFLPRLSGPPSRGKSSIVVFPECGWDYFAFFFQDTQLNYISQHPLVLKPPQARILVNWSMLLASSRPGPCRLLDFLFFPPTNWQKAEQSLTLAE